MKTIQNNLKRLIALFLSLLMIVTNEPFVDNLVFADDIDDETYDEIDLDFSEEEIVDDFILGGNGGSDENGNNKIISSTFECENLSYYDIETKGTFYYTEDFFKNPSTTYDEHLATTSLELALAGVANSMEDVKDKYVNTKDFLSKMGFRNITPNEDYLKEPEKNTMGSVCANKPIYLKNSDGSVEKYNLITIVTRGANYKLEWLSNFKMGDTGDHAGFTESTDIVYNHFTSFYNEHKDDFGNIPVKIWLAGYSRGAAIANMLAARLTDEANSFNTNKSNIYCITSGTPMGVLKSEHTLIPLDSYTNIHNIVDLSDLIPLLSPSDFGFGRYGIDHPVPNFVSENWHDQTKKNKAIQNNKTFKNKYSKMKTYLDKINPNYKTDITTFSMYKLEPITPNLEFMKYTKLGEETFKPTSDEKEYYKGYEYFTTFVNEIFSKELMHCSYPGTNYGTIVGRDRYYTKYQDLILFALEKFYVDPNSSSTIEKIKKNAIDNVYSLFSLITIVQKFLFTDEELPDRNHYTLDEHPTEHSSYYNAYDQLREAYKIVFKDAFSESEYEFLINRSDDITDLVMDLFIIDYRTSSMPKQATIGSIIQNASIASSFHSGLNYLAWVEVEDSYYGNPPTGTINIDGYKSFIFSDLTDTTIKIYDEFDQEMGFYTIDNVIEESEGLHSTYLNIVKSYNPEGLELRIPSNLAYDFEVSASNKTIDKITFKEFFITDNSFYRNTCEKTNVVLNENQSLYVECNIGGTTNVFSCYPFDKASDYQKKTMKIATISDITYLSGNDAYSYSSLPIFRMINNNISGALPFLEEENIATLSQISTKSEIESETVVETETIETVVETTSFSEEEITVEKAEESTVEEAKENNVVETSSFSKEETTVVEEESTVEEDEENNVGEASSFPEEEATVVEEETEEELEAETEIEEETEPETEVEANEEEPEVETTESENQISAFTNTDDEEETEETQDESLETTEEESEVILETIERVLDTDIYKANDKYVVNFETTGIGTFYYFDGSNFVEGASGESYDEGTRIRIAAPLKYGKSPFYGWTLSNNDGKFLNAEGVDTVIINDESDSNNSIYTFVLKDYDVNIKANYFDGPYYLNIKVNPLKGSMEPSDFPTKFDKVETFESRKNDLTIIEISPYTFNYWTDGKNHYDNLGDYIWEYNDNITLEAVFTKPGGGGGGGSGGGGGGSGGGTSHSATQMNNLINGKYVSNNINSASFHNNETKGKWIFDSIKDMYRFGTSLSMEDIDYNSNKEINVVIVDGVSYLANGVYKLGANGNYYLFDENGLMRTGFNVVDGKTYYFEEYGDNIGAMASGERVINGIIYNFDANGEIIYPEDKIYKVVSGVWKYYPETNEWGYAVSDKNGVEIILKNGMFAIMNTDGTFTNFYFDALGNMQKGNIEYNGKIYELN